MKSKILYRVRKFINKKGHQSTAFIFAEIYKNISKGRYNKKTKKRKKDYVWYGIELKLSDCDRNINLSIDCDNKRQVKNSIYKLDVIIDILTKLKEFLIKEFKIK